MRQNSRRRTTNPLTGYIKKDSLNIEKFLKGLPLDDYWARQDHRSIDDVILFLQAALFYIQNPHDTSSCYKDTAPTIYYTNHVMTRFLNHYPVLKTINLEELIERLNQESKIRQVRRQNHTKRGFDTSELFYCTSSKILFDNLVKRPHANSYFVNLLIKDDSYVVRDEHSVIAIIDYSIMTELFESRVVPFNLLLGHQEQPLFLIALEQHTKKKSLKEKMNRAFAS